MVAGSLAPASPEALVEVVGGLAQAQEGLLEQQAAGGPVLELRFVFGQDRAAVLHLAARVGGDMVAVDEDVQAIPE